MRTRAARGEWIAAKRGVIGEQVKQQIGKRANKHFGK